MKIRKTHESRAIVFLWVYDIVKYLVIRDLLESQGVDPLIFLFFDMVTVPPFIMGSARLVNSLTCQALKWPEVMGWGMIVFANAFLPYLYVAVTGQKQFGPVAWTIFSGVVILVMANMVRTILIQVREKRCESADLPFKP